MASLKKCKDCGHDVSKNAASCPNCGAPLKKNSGNVGCGTTTAVLLFLGYILYVIGSNSGGSTGTAVRTTNTAPSDGKVAYYAKDTVNVRRGPGTDHEVIDQLTKGQMRRCYPHATGENWVKCAQDEYIHASLLSRSAPPPLEIASWNWYPDSSFGIEGAVIWTVEVQNNTSRYLDAVRVDFSTYDSAGNLITTDFGYVQGLSPGGTAATKGYATYYGREEKAKIRIVP